MDKILWDDRFSVGVAEFDDQHRRLAELINQLGDCIGQSAGSEAVADVLSALSEYASTHFEAEEALLQRLGYPELNAQWQEHTEFCETVANACYDASCGSVDLPALSAYLMHWWEDHILLFDMRYKSFVAGQIPPSPNKA
ncbi:MAG TPA: bacteriohemerythrin [Rhodocyclaceae bacterium]|jgi:hemerythrin|nr:hemerythrin family protein [Betaproteobacteria bacterium]HMV00745.1 bacteriohemerythrin [Rhodocyclaceae bacterium]HMV21822.1 bacteriohemerythrin [Rhodocyclaceae bacterium]HNE44097.1 bacteriohemerythrin [Rhodocyclaceae bacterium]HNM23019.1 bacteriohemerythrin [Rhodocyclaceae bacterium]